MMGYMIYIYLALAFVLAGGGWFIGFHGGRRIGHREGVAEVSEERRKRGLTEYRLGFIDGLTSPRVQPITSAFGYKRESPSPSIQLSELMHDHLKIMDGDE